MSGITAGELVAARIPQRRSGLRYATDAVDAFLDEATVALMQLEAGRAVSLTSYDVESRQFPRVGFFGSGYNADLVDQLLDRVYAQLGSQGRDGQLRAAQEAADEAKLLGMLEDMKSDMRKRRGED